MLAARRGGIAWVNSKRVYEIVAMQACVDAGEKLVDLILLTRNFDLNFASENARQESKAQFNEPYLLLSCSLQCHRFKL